MTYSMKRIASVYLAVLVLSGATTSGQVSQESFFNWETPPVHPIALSPDGTRLVVCNLPDNRLEVFSVTTGVPIPFGHVSVGLDPTSVRFRGDDEVWVANFISDSVSIVDLNGMRVVATLETPNEPSDIVFAGSPAKAFITCAQPNLVRVIDADTKELLTDLKIDGNRPKALAVSPDGNTVHVAIFESGNASTIISSGLNMSVPPPSPVDFPHAPSGGQNPPPNSGAIFSPPINPDISDADLPPRVSLIVKRDSNGRWMDDNAGDWTSFVSGTNSVFTGRPVGWDLHDHDLAVIDAGTFDVKYARGLMNICMGVGVNPVSGQITVVGTDARNHLRFEPVLKSIFVSVHLAMVDPLSLSGETVDLNSHLDYATTLLPENERRKSIGDPRCVVWNSNGDRGYVTGMGSSNLVIVDSTGRRVGKRATVEVGEGPTGMALDESRDRLYVFNRFDASISVIDTVSEAVVATVPMFDPTPLVVRKGRPHLYGTHKTSGLGQVACGSCHVDARFDRLAWDLGAPTGKIQLLSTANFGRFPPAITNHFHPMKGPMTTQTFQDIIGHEPFHWRGDQPGLEDFSGTFTNLQGAPITLTTNEMQDFENFLATVRFAPNPFRTLSNALPNKLSLPGHKSLGRGQSIAGTLLPDGDAINGQHLFLRPGSSGCIECHTLPSGVGVDLTWTGREWEPFPVGPRGEHHSAFVAIGRSSFLPFKIQSLRNLFDKFGMDYQETTNRSGFGFFHDGSTDTLVRFMQDGFDIRDDQETADLLAFLLAFTGSDLITGAFNDRDHPPGARSLDTHAAVGRQSTIDDSGNSQLVELLIEIATPPGSRIDLVAKGFMDGLSRGWFFDRTVILFQSDRQAETISVEDLLALAGEGNEITFTAVPRGSGLRIGIDRDEDGLLDGDELDNLADFSSAFETVPKPEVNPPFLNGRGLELSWKVFPTGKYQVQFKSVIDEVGWTDLGPAVTATGNRVEVTDFPVTQQRFYRLILVP